MNCPAVAVVPCRNLYPLCPGRCRDLAGSRAHPGSICRQDARLWRAWVYPDLGFFGGDLAIRPRIWGKSGREERWPAKATRYDARAEPARAALMNIEVCPRDDS